MSLPIIAAAAGLFCCFALGRAAPGIVRAGRPGLAVVLLAGASVVLAMGTGIALGSIGVAAVAGLAAVAGEGEWSVPVLRAEVAIPSPLGWTAAALVVVLALSALARAVRIGIVLVRAEHVCRSLPPEGPVVIVDDDSVDAFTVAGIRGRVVLSGRLLAALTTNERRVLTAHELSHLHRRHHLYVHAVDLAAAANPLLRRASDAVRLGVERWADEDAAASVGDRTQVGRALARVALVRAALGRPGPPEDRESRLDLVGSVPVGALSAATHQVATRVQSLLDPVAKPARVGLAGACTAAVVVLIVAVAALLHIHQAIELASWGLPD